MTVRNTGKRSGAAVPELYVSLPSQEGVPEPPLQLKASDCCIEVMTGAVLPGGCDAGR